MGWEFETGLADDFDLDITNAYFAYNPKLAGKGGEPRVALHLEGKAEGGSFESPTELVDEQALLFSIGDKWMVTDDGAKVVHESGQDRGFNVQTSIVRILKSAMEAGAPLKDRGDATEAKIWVGLRLHFKRKTVPMGGEIGDKDVLFVEKFLGEAEKGKKTGTGAAPAKAASSKMMDKAPAGDDVTLISDTVGGAIFKRLQKLAAGSEDYETWAAEAVELPKVKDADDIQDLILDEDRGLVVWEALRS